jgi:FtsP/CotA-like multicopper oxidase with cupredoxin domain
MMHGAKGEKHGQAPHGATKPHSQSAALLKGRIVDLKIEHRKVVGTSNVIRVSQGETVNLRWTTDEDTTVHLHGYDIEKQVKTGGPAVFTFKAHATGRFPITAHGFGQHHHGKKDSPDKDETALLYLEVRPR